jgi:hypothetical protein
MDWKAQHVPRYETSSILLLFLFRSKYSSQRPILKNSSSQQDTKHQNYLMKQLYHEVLVLLIYMMTEAFLDGRSAYDIIKFLCLSVYPRVFPT